MARKDHLPAAAQPPWVQVSVPAELYEDVIEFIAERLRSRRGHVERAQLKPSRRTQGSTAEEEVWEDEELEDLLTSNPKLRQALIAVARRGPLWAEDVAREAGVEPGRAWGGFMSRALTRARNRGHGELPIWRDDFDGRQYLYAMNEDDAQFIKDWARVHGYA